MRFVFPFSVCVCVRVLPGGVASAVGGSRPFRRRCHGALIQLTQRIDSGVIIWSARSTGLGSEPAADGLDARTKKQKQTQKSSLTDTLHITKSHKPLLHVRPTLSGSGCPAGTCEGCTEPEW